MGAITDITEPRSRIAQILLSHMLHASTVAMWILRQKCGVDPRLNGVGLFVCLFVDFP
jgi:hypothetical protein